MESIISLLLLGNELSAQYIPVSYIRPSIPMTVIYDSGDKSFDAAPDNNITTIAITDAMSFSMDITVNSFYYKPPRGWSTATIFECDSEELGEWVKLPKVALIDENNLNGHQGFYTQVAGFSDSIHSIKYAQTQTFNVEENSTYHLEFIFSQSTLTITQDDVVRHKHKPHTWLSGYSHLFYSGYNLSENAKCYVGDSPIFNTYWSSRSVADVTVSNIVIRSECADGYEFIDGVCYATCPIGYTGSLDMCTSDDIMRVVYDSGDVYFDASSGNKIADIPITDSMSFSMDIAINKDYIRPAGGWSSATVFECSNDKLKNWVQLPRVAVVLFDVAGAYEGFGVIGSSHDNEDGQVQTAHVEEGKTYHLQFIFTQSTMTTLQDNVITFDTDDFAAHDVSDSVECFVGNNEWTTRPSANVTVSNIVILAKSAAKKMSISFIFYINIVYVFLNA